jgi:phospholipid-binding lipoprotein MlaA
LRSTPGIGPTALLLAILGLAVSGCSTIPQGHGTGPRSSLIELSRASLGGESPLTEVNAPTAATAPTPEVAAVSPEPLGQTTRAAGPDEAIETSLTRPAFVPVAVDLIPPGASPHLIALADRPGVPAGSTTAQSDAGSSELSPDVDEIEEYDPWERYNEKAFTFNYNFDRYVLKPVAKGYNFIVPDVVQQMIGHGFDNIRVVPKLVNNILQWNWTGFSVELGRFVINSTLGIGGLFDIARQEFGLEKTKVDFGQTLGKWGVKPGPFVIVPFLPPLTVRDGIGFGVDNAMDPLGYVLPFIPDKLVMRIGEIVNDRSLNLELFQGFEETTIDLYSAVRNGYLQRRYNLIHNSP